ncbi:hypothetical protein TNCV_4687201 [Trichonephila clavipes]|nr:hypothetical protein TNCV_4687201 [Trichonephila clavipes]
MDVCNCIVPLRQVVTLNSSRAASPLVRLVEEEVRWEAPDHHQGVFNQNWGGTEPKSYCHMRLFPEGWEKKINHDVKVEQIKKTPTKNGEGGLPQRTKRSNEAERLRGEGKNAGRKTGRPKAVNQDAPPKPLKETDSSKHVHNRSLLKKQSGHGSLVVKASDRGWRIKSSSPVPLKTRRVGERCTLNLSRAQTFSRCYKKAFADGPRHFEPWSNTHHGTHTNYHTTATGGRLSSRQIKRRDFSGTGLELMTRQPQVRYFDHDKFRSSATKLVSLSFKYINSSSMPPRGKELSKDLKDAIIKLYKESKSQRQIAKIIGKSPATVQKIIEKFQAEGNTLNKPTG